MHTNKFIEEVGARTAGGLSEEQARTATRATLETLAARISAKEASDLGAQLSRDLAGALRTGAPRSAFSSNEFLDRVAEREGVSRSEAFDHVRAVMNVLAEAVSAHELNHVRKELSPDYDALFEAPAVIGRPESHIARRRPEREPAHPERPRGGRAAVQAEEMQVDVAARGRVSQSAREQARREISRLARLIKGPILGAHIVLTQESNPRIAQPARAEGQIDLPGVEIRARVAAASMDAAVPELAERLQRRIRDRIEVLVTAHRRAAEPRPGEWFHGALPTAHPEHAVRPTEERQIVRRKSYAVDPMDIAQAAAGMDSLDHHFFLFRDADTGADAVIYRNDDGRLAVIDPPGTSRSADGVVAETSRFSQPVGLETAVDEMNALDHRFLFFINADTGRGNVIYTRYDGHYGLIEPAEEAG